jgi:hypothetical protein
MSSVIVSGPSPVTALVEARLNVPTLSLACSGRGGGRHVDRVRGKRVDRGSTGDGGEVEDGLGAGATDFSTTAWSSRSPWTMWIASSPGKGRLSTTVTSW